VLLDRATAGWRSAVGECFPNPHLDEHVVFEDFFPLRIWVTCTIFLDTMGLPLSISIQQHFASLYFHPSMQSLSRHRSVFQYVSLFLLPQILPRSLQSGWWGISCAAGRHGFLVQDSPAQ
jgi:hypothetical protein